MPDATKTHIHVHKSWIAGSEARFLCRCRRWSYGETERDREGEREIERAKERERVRASERARVRQRGAGTNFMLVHIGLDRNFFLHPSAAPASTSASHTCSPPLHIHHLRPANDERKTSFLYSSDLWHLDHCLLRTAKDQWKEVLGCTAPINYCRKQTKVTT